METATQEVEKPADSTVEKNIDTKVENKNEQVPYYRFKEINEKYKVATDELLKFKSEQEEARLKKLEEDGDLKAIIDEKDKQIAALSSKATEWDTYQSDRRDVLLSKLSDDDKKVLENAKLELIEHFVSKQDKNIKPNIGTIPGTTKNVILSKDWTTMDDGEKRKNWGDILKSYKKN